MAFSVLSVILYSLLGFNRADLLPEDINSSTILAKDDFVASVERACTGDIGRVQNILISVTDTDMEVTYSPPVGYENCNLDYEVTYWNGVNLAVYQRSVDKNLWQSYNYWEGRVLCKLVNLDITPIYNGIRGTTYNSNQFTDKFTPHIDIGPARNVTLKLTDILNVKWVAPIDYDSCSIYFRIETRDINGQTLNEGNFQGFEWKYDYGLDNNYCKQVVVIVESFFRGITGGLATASIQLGPPPSGSC